MRSAAKQHGLSFTGFVFWGAIVAFFGVIGFRVLPPYIEYFTVKKVMDNVLRDNADGTPAQLRNAFDLKASADYIDTVKGKDIDVDKQSGHITMNATWTTKLHLFGNVSLVLDFDATVEK
jgi:hypothetical protein